MFKMLESFFGRIDIETSSHKLPFEIFNFSLPLPPRLNISTNILKKHEKTQTKRINKIDKVNGDSILNLSVEDGRKG